MGFILLGELADLTTLEIACNLCDRQGRVGVTRLLAQHGPSMPIPALLALLSADCPKRLAGEKHDVCGAHLPQLPAIFLATGQH